MVGPWRRSSMATSHPEKKCTARTGSINPPPPPPLPACGCGDEARVAAQHDDDADLEAAAWLLDLRQGRVYASIKEPNLGTRDEREEGDLERAGPWRRRWGRSSLHGDIPSREKVGQSSTSYPCAWLWRRGADHRCRAQHDGAVDLEAPLRIWPPPPPPAGSAPRERRGGDGAAGCGGEERRERRSQVGTAVEWVAGS